MGCTSSAPKSIASPSSSTGKKLKLSEGTQEESIMAETMNINIKSEDVLPSSSCDKDNLDGEQLVKNNNSIVDIKKMDTNESASEHDGHAESPESNMQNSFETTVHIEENLTTLEEVLEKVVEINAERKSQSSSFNDLKTIEDQNVTPEVGAGTNKSYESLVEEKHDLPGGKNNEASTEDKDSSPSLPAPTSQPVSPSQSSSSRVTRWEALADIAAELPPSLAVDRVTGEIFTLTK